MSKPRLNCFLPVMMLMLAGCVTMDDPAPRLDILHMALSQDVAGLSARADTGDGKAQYALSIIYQYGLYGQVKDNTKSTQLKRMALNSKSYMPITQYVPAFNGQPSRSYIINTTRYDVTAYDANSIEVCASVLDKGLTSEAAKSQCGGETEYGQLADLWARAKR